MSEQRTWSPSTTTVLTWSEWITPEITPEEADHG